MLTEVAIVYKRKEIATRISILFSANILATAFQGLIAAPIYSELGGARGLSGWRWMYLIMGAWSLFFSVVGLFFFPNKPTTTWWLTPAQKTLAADRIAADTVGKKEDVNLLKGLRECLRDRRVWAFMAAQHLQTATSSFRIFLPTLIDTLGFSRTVTLVLTCPPYILAGISSILGGLSSGRFNERTWHITIIKLISILGFVLACATLNTGARYFAAFVFVAATYPVSPLILSWTGITCGQTSEKRAASLAAVNTLSSVSLIWTPVGHSIYSAPLLIFVSYRIQMCIPLTGLTVSMARLRGTSLCLAHGYERGHVLRHHCNKLVCQMGPYEGE